MLSCARLRETMALRGAATDTLRAKGGISSSAIRRLKAGESVTTNTLDALCKIPDCGITNLYTPDKA